MTKRSLLCVGLLALFCMGSVLATRLPESLKMNAEHDTVDADLDDDNMSIKEEMLLAARPRMARVGRDDDALCHKNGYRKRTLKVVKETPFVGLFPNLKGQRRFEASGITYAKDAYWVVFDNLEALGKLDLQFRFRGAENALIGPVEEESQFEGIQYMPSTDTFLAVRESFEHDEHGLVPLTVEIKVDEAKGTHEILRSCPVKFVLQDGNKGFESLYYWEEPSKTNAKEVDKFILGLCESNYCATIIGPDPPGLERGNGRAVYAQYRAPTSPGDECMWKVIKVINIPESAYLLDYSAFAFDGRKGNNVAIVSQEDAAVWVGEFDWERMEFVEEVGTMYHFPRDEDCSKIYCNVEGIAWLDASRFVVTSDKSKKIQDHRCMNKDQTVHVMALP